MEQKSFVYFGVKYRVSRVQDTETCFRVYSSAEDKEFEFFSKSAIFLFGLLESSDLHAYNAAKSYFVNMFNYLHNL